MRMLKKLRTWLQEERNEVPTELAQAGINTEHVAALGRSAPEHQLAHAGRG